MRRAPGGSPTERPRAVVILVALIALSVAARWYVTLQTLSVAGCADDACSHTVWVTFASFRGLLITLPVLSTVIIIVRGRRQQSSWWAPTACIALLVVATVTAVAVIQTTVAG
ncbi:hypothetical protein [Microbacterium sp.]|uniref:hypothetical protein n=1 Tax=Microbacterium sp. TaxID=51671 RepID=UPI0039E4559F